MNKNEISENDYVQGKVVKIASEINRRNNPNLSEKKILGRIKRAYQKPTGKVTRKVGNRRGNLNEENLVKKIQEKLEKKLEDYSLATAIVTMLEEVVNKNLKCKEFLYTTNSGEKCKYEVFTNQNNQPFAICQKQKDGSDFLTILTVDKNGRFIKQDVKSWEEIEEFETIKTIGQVLAEHEYSDEDDRVKSFGEIIAEYKNSPIKYEKVAFRYPKTDTSVFDGEYFVETPKSFLAHFFCGDNVLLYTSLDENQGQKWDKKVSKILDSLETAKNEKRAEIINNAGKQMY